MIRYDRKKEIKGTSLFSNNQFYLSAKKSLTIVRLLLLVVGRDGGSGPTIGTELVPQLL